jgi:hypothetical protein
MLLAKRATIVVLASTALLASGQEPTPKIGQRLRRQTSGLMPRHPAARKIRSKAFGIGSPRVVFGWGMVWRGIWQWRLVRHGETMDGVAP